MCVFCAAVPMTISLGAAAQGKISETRKTIQQSDQPVKQPYWMTLPVKKLTATLVVLLIVCAAAYHIAFFPHAIT